jgi:hypothetical protein
VCLCNERTEQQTHPTKQTRYIVHDKSKSLINFTPYLLLEENAVREYTRSVSTVIARKKSYGSKRGA